MDHADFRGPADHGDAVGQHRVQGDRKEGVFCDVALLLDQTDAVDDQVGLDGSQRADDLVEIERIDHRADVLSGEFGDVGDLRAIPAHGHPRLVEF